jgi:uncharacterized membrane protein
MELCAVLSLLLAAIFFAGTHLGVAGTTIRDRAIAAFGQSGYRVAFSIASVVGLAWLLMAYNRTRYVVTWGIPDWWKPFAIILNNPDAPRFSAGRHRPDDAKPDRSRPGKSPRATTPGHRARVTRHPFLTGVGLWTLVHLIGDGDVASLVFFAVWAVVARRDGIDR